MPWRKDTVSPSPHWRQDAQLVRKKLANSNTLGDTAVALLKAGAETDKKDTDGYLALDLAPDKEVRKYIEQAAEREGIEL